MTVQELIEKLNTVTDKDKVVYIWNFESDGISPIVDIEVDNDGDIIITPEEI